MKYNQYEWLKYGALAEGRERQRERGRQRETKKDIERERTFIRSGGALRAPRAHSDRGVMAGGASPRFYSFQMAPALRSDVHAHTVLTFFCSWTRVTYCSRLRHFLWIKFSSVILNWVLSNFLWPAILRSRRILSVLVPVELHCKDARACTPWKMQLNNSALVVGLC